MQKMSIVLAILIGSLVVSSTAYAAHRFFRADLRGGQEAVFDGGVFVPGGRETDGEARITAVFNTTFTAVTVELKIRGLEGNFTAAHFHCGRAGENGPVIFGLISPGPLMFDGERIKGTLTNSNLNVNADCVPDIGRSVNNIVALAAAMQDGLIYINVHSDVFPGGELRAQMGLDRR